MARHRPLRQSSPRPPPVSVCVNEARRALPCSQKTSPTSSPSFKGRRRPRIAHRVPLRAQPAMSFFYAYEPHFTCNVWVPDWWEKLCEACWKPGDRGEKDLGQDGGYIIFIGLRRRTTLVGEAVHKRFANFTSLLSVRTRRCPRPFGNDREQITAGHTLQLVKHAFICLPNCVENNLVLTRIRQCGSFRGCGARFSRKCRDTKQANADVSASRGHSARSRQLDRVGDCAASKKGALAIWARGKKACASCLCGAESLVGVREQVPAASSGPP